MIGTSTAAGTSVPRPASAPSSCIVVSVVIGKPGQPRAQRVFVHSSPGGNSPSGKNTPELQTPSMRRQPTHSGTPSATSS